eukprot:4312223-Amphidinium_carterae.1
MNNLVTKASLGKHLKETEECKPHHPKPVLVLAKNWPNGLGFPPQSFAERGVSPRAWPVREQSAEVFSFQDHKSQTRQSLEHMSEGAAVIGTLPYSST